MYNNYFYYKGKRYYVGTTMKLRDEKRQYFKFHDYMQFSRSDNNGMCYFHSFYDIFEHKIPQDSIEEYIEFIQNAIYEPQNENYTIPLKYIDGIGEATVWYILIMIGAIFIKGFANVLGTWIMATWIFVSWLKKKANGR